MEALLTILFLAAGLWSIQKFSFFNLEDLSTRILQITFIAKVICGFVLYLLYTKVYESSSADIFKYFEDGKVMHDAFWISPPHYLRMFFGFDTDEISRQYYIKMSHWYREHNSLVYNDNRTVTRLNSLIHFISFGYYHAHNIVLCFIAFIGQTALFKFFQSTTKIPSYLLLIAVFYVPSIALWTAGNLKEVVLFFALGMFVHTTNKLIINKLTLKYLTISVFTFLLALFIKPYVIIIMCPCLVAFVIARGKSNLKTVGIHLTTWVLGIGIALSIGLFFKWNTLYIISRKQKDFVGLAEHAKSGSYLPSDFLEPNLSDFIAKAPLALYRAFFRPFFFESKSPLIIFNGLENLLFFLLLLCALLFRKKLNEQSLNLSLFFLFFVFFNLLLIGYTTPVMGAIVRYKTPILPFMLALFLTLIDIEKLKKGKFNLIN